MTSSEQTPSSSPRETNIQRLMRQAREKSAGVVTPVTGATQERHLDFPIAEGMGELAAKLKEDQVTAADIRSRISVAPDHAKILETDHKLRNDLAEILCRFGPLKYFGHSDYYTFHVVPMLAGGVTKESLMSVLEKGADAPPEVWNDMLDYYDKRREDYSEEYRREYPRINRETELNYFKYSTIISAGLYTADDPRVLFKKTLEENMSPVEKDSLIRDMVVRLGYDNGTIVEALRDWSQNSLWGLKDCIVKAIVNSSKSLKELDRMDPKDFLLNDVPEIAAIAKLWKEKGNTRDDVLEALKVDLHGDRETESALERFRKIPIPNKPNKDSAGAEGDASGEKRFAETAGARRVFLEKFINPEEKQKMSELFSKIVFHNNQLTPEDMDLWAEENQYLKVPNSFWHDSKETLRAFEESDVEKALLSKENLDQFRQILVEQNAAQNGRVRTALLVEFIHRPPENEKDLEVFNEFVKILKGTKKNFKDYFGYMDVMSWLRSDLRGPEDTVEKIIKDLDRTDN